MSNLIPLLRSRLLAVVLLLGPGIIVIPGSGQAFVKLEWMPQQHKYDCGRAVLASIIAKQNGISAVEAYRRISGPQNEMLSVEQMIERARVPFGVKLELMGPGAVVSTGGVGAASKLKVDWNQYVDDLRLLLEKDQSRVLIVPTVKGSIAHYVALVGAKDGKFKALDPDPITKGEIKEFSAQQLIQLMTYNGGLVLDAMIRE